MAQIILRNIDKALKAQLQLRAQRNGRSLQDEIREILHKAVSSRAKKSVPRLGLGTEIAALITKYGGLDIDIPELRGHEVKPATFD
jgi:plasmid stability protein